MWRSLLYVPGDRPDLIDKAWSLATGGGLGAPDALILDLEDAVPAARKATARAAVREALARDRSGAPGLVVRANPAPLGAADLDALIALRPDAVMIAKAEITTIPAALLATQNVPIIALIETAAGLRDLDRLAAISGMLNLAIGEADLGAELGVARDAEHAWWPLRLGLVVASAAHALRPPTAPVSTDIADLDGLRATSIALRDAGFGARAAVHPRQIPVINEVFTPSEADVARSQRLVETYDAALAGGAAVFVGDDGRLVDEAVVRSARRLLGLATTERSGGN